MNQIPELAAETPARYTAEARSRKRRHRNNGAETITSPASAMDNTTPDRDSLLDYLQGCFDIDMDIQEMPDSPGNNRPHSHHQAQQTDDLQIPKRQMDTERTIIDDSVSPPIIQHKPKKHIITEQKKRTAGLRYLICI